MSRRRRDRRAYRTARYIARCEALTGGRYTGVGHWPMSGYTAMKWLMHRKVNRERIDVQGMVVERMFGILEDWE